MGLLKLTFSSQLGTTLCPIYDHLMFKEPEWIIIKVILDLVGILVRADSYFELWWGFCSIPGQWFGTFLPQSSKLESWWSWNWKNISMSVNSLKRCQMFWVHLETIKNIPFRFNFQLALKWKEPTADVCCAHINYHLLTVSRKWLMEMVTEYQTGLT